MRKILLAILVLFIGSTFLALVPAPTASARHNAVHCFAIEGNDTSPEYQACVAAAPDTVAEQSAWCEGNRPDSEFESCMQSEFGVDVSGAAAGAGSQSSPAAAGACDNSFLGFPTWHKYLKKETGRSAITGADECNVKIDGLSDVWLIVAAVLEILLRVASLAAVIMIIYAGFTYMLSQSQPDKTSQSLKTVIGALVGLTISVAAAALVSFIASRF